VTNHFACQMDNSSLFYSSMLYASRNLPSSRSAKSTPSVFFFFFFFFSRRKNATAQTFFSATPARRGSVCGPFTLRSRVVHTRLLC
jgi:hypothetical protein